MVIKMTEDNDYRQQIDKWFARQGERMDRQDIRLDKLEDRVDKISDIQIIHGQQIAGILESLKDIKGDTVWVRRTVTGAVLGGTVSAIIGFIVFAIQKLN